MLFTDGQRQTYARLTGELMQSKSAVADALDALEQAREQAALAEHARTTYVRGMVLERNMQGNWTVAPDGSALIPE